MPSKVKSTSWTTNLNDLPKSPTSVNNEIIIIESINLSPKTKLSIITVMTGRDNNKFSPSKIAGMLNPIDKIRNDRFSFEIISEIFSDSIITQIGSMFYDF
ncbi:MAG: hypothetical protein IH618_01455 [Ignavibacteriaceae bacterium]|nr:hypothetical protein [Ignavibacteriaceae bacterium]